MTTLWDTTGSAVVKELAAQRRTGGAVLSGVALTLVVVADESRVGDAEEAATHAAESHPCRRARRGAPADRRARAPAGRRGADRRPARPRRGGRHADVRPARAARGVRRPAAAGRRRAGGDLVARRSPGPAGHRRAGGVRRPADHRQLDPRGLPRRAAHPRRRLRARGHRPRLDPVHVVAGDPRLHPGRGLRPPRRAGAGHRRAHRGRSGATRAPSCWAAGCPRGAARRSPSTPAGACPGPAAWTPSSSSWTRRRRSASTPTGRAARRSPSRSAPTPPWRSPSGRWATCSARSCAGWTPTSPTGRRSRRRPA